jgi:1-acyl-sn-glycerol-3-phosphate acyltransferase
MKAGVVIRSGLFLVVQVLLTPPFAIIALLTFPLPPITRYRIINTWSRLVVLAASGICGIRYRVRGTEHLPSQPCVILAKHQSAWETISFSMIFPPQVLVVKRELLWIPVFGSWLLGHGVSRRHARRTGQPRALPQRRRSDCRKRQRASAASRA